MNVDKDPSDDASIRQNIMSQTAQLSKYRLLTEVGTKVGAY